ncbi:MAG: baseplate J/gp47 family protein [Caldilineaceae bacterium]
MTEILQIDPEASVEAVRRQLAQYHRDRVALAVPEGWTELDSVARLRLLQRQAQIQRCHLSLVTRDEPTRQAAAQLGIPVFFHTADAAHGSWRMRPPLPLIHPRNPAASLPEPPLWRSLKKGEPTTVIAAMARTDAHQARQQRIRTEANYRRPLPAWMRVLGIVAVLSLTVLFLALFALYVLPAATITLEPGRKAVHVMVRLTANPNISEPDLDRNQMPARLIETNIEQTGKIATTGSQQKPTDKAQGVVVFSNLGSSAVFIPAGSRVSTSNSVPVLFRTTVDANVEGRVGAAATVPVEAVDPGVEGNVRANTINTVEGALRYRVGVSNPGGTAGGGSQLASVVTQQDRDKLLAQLEASAAAKAYDALKVELKPGEWLPPEAIQTFVVAIPAFSHFNDEQATELTLTMRSLVTGVAVDEATARNLLFAAAQTQVPPNGKLVATSLTTQRAPGANIEDGTVQFTVTVNADYVVPIDPAEVRKIAAGRSPQAVITELQKRLLLVRAPAIYQDPAWMKTLPPFGNRIQVRIEYADSAKNK